jgi:Spy/CpxP family protein refolding chaperone
MKNGNVAKALLVAALVFGVAALAYAGDGYGPGYGRHMMGRGGMWGHMMDDGPGYGHMRGYMGCGADLSREDAAKLEDLREKFFDQTRDLRNTIRDKRFALNDELEKSDPDQAKVINLQKEISALESEFDQKSLAHRLEVRKALPETVYGAGYGRRGACW